MGAIHDSVTFNAARILGARRIPALSDVLNTTAYIIVSHFAWGQDLQALLRDDAEFNGLHV